MYFRCKILKIFGPTICFVNGFSILKARVQFQTLLFLRPAKPEFITNVEKKNFFFLNLLSEKVLFFASCGGMHFADNLLYLTYKAMWKDYFPL